MSIKHLFDKGKIPKPLQQKSKRDLAEDLESSRFIDAHNIKEKRFIPDTDFTTASNFARFGLAEEYYEQSIKRVYQTYPYDGSLAEKTEWENESSYLDLFLFENEYPRSNGFININPEINNFAGSAVNNLYSSSAPQYVLVYGNPHADPSGDFKSELAAGPSRAGISKANIWDTNLNRVGNLAIDPEDGLTVEFWLKKDGWHEVSTAYEVIFSNQLTGSSPSYPSYFTIQARGSTPESINVAFVSGCVPCGGIFSALVSLDTNLSNIADGKWRHYAITAKNNNSKINFNLYVDGAHVTSDESSVNIRKITGSQIAAIGALPDKIGTNYGAGWGNIVSASFDEFRYWRTERNAQQIGRNWRTQVHGGTNTDNIKYDNTSSPVDLGVYFKFNEGIVGQASIDSTILDYSGRISNGTFINYNSTNSRNTGSAIISSSAATKEFEDPIIYEEHPSVSALLDAKKISGSMHDHQNFSSIFRSMPAWLAEEDENKSNQLKNLTQIMGSFFDEMYLQIDSLPRLKDVNYPYDNNHENPLPFANRLLSGRLYDVPELFANASALSKYLHRDEKRLFENKLYETKNLIYQNIYNNLSYIQKSKGTFKSLRNFLRCFGVDEELVKLNLYAKDDVYELKDNFSSVAVKKKYADFDDAETRQRAGESITNAYSANVYQYYDSSNSDSISYIPAITGSSASGSAFTVEAEIIFPKRSPTNDFNFNAFPGLTSSLFGFHDVVAVNNDTSFFSASSNDNASLSVLAVRQNSNSRNVRFMLTGSNTLLTELTSSTYIDVYDNEKWNFAFKLRPTKWPLSIVTGSLVGANAYTYELFGASYLAGQKRNEFTITGTLSSDNALKFIERPKRVFVGANRDNFDGDIIHRSDVKASSVRYWFNYQTDDAIRAHARDAENFGTLHPFQNNDAYRGSSSFAPETKNLGFHWTFENVTGSDANGRFLVNDTTSGSAYSSNHPDLSPYSGIGYLNNFFFSGRGDNFVSTENFRDQAIDVEFISSARQKLPEVVNSDDMVKLLTKQDDVVFTRDTTYVQHVLSIEKSMYQTVSEEMLKRFATIVDFNNLIGEPVNRYRQGYKKLEKLKNIFFADIENDIDLDKFIEFYKWIDDAVTIMISQLLPASSNHPELIRNMVESHILERNKYTTKFPTMDLSSLPVASVSPVAGFNIISLPQAHFNPDSTDKGGDVRYISRLDSYSTLQPPPPQSPPPQNKGANWWRYRAARSTPEISSSVVGVNESRDAILKSLITVSSGSEQSLRKLDGTVYARSYLFYRNNNVLANYQIGRNRNLKAGSNSRQTKKYDFYKGVIKWGSDDDFIFIDMDNELPKKDILDVVIPPEVDKKKVLIDALTMRADQTVNSDAAGTGANDRTPEDRKVELIAPFSIFSSSVESGYQGLYSDQFKIQFTALHEDKYGQDLEIPMQGTFTEKYVGGMQHRHVKLNQGSDTAANRPEGWHLEQFLNKPSSTNVKIIDEEFTNASTTPTNDITILSLPLGSTSPEPSPYEYWSNGTGADNEWTFLEGSTPSAGTGPASGKYAYCEVLPSRVGQTFGFVTPLIDLLENDNALDSAGTVSYLNFEYHMHGLGIGNLKVQVSRDKTFESDITEIFSIAGQQHLNATDSFTSSGNISLRSFAGQRIYIRFLYTAGVSHLGDCAIKDIEVRYPYFLASKRDSFKLMHPTFDNHNRPYATLTRDHLAKRPVNIKNIHMTGNSPTVAGNYLDRYEYVSTVSPEANDPFFVKNSHLIEVTSSERLAIAKVQDLLGQLPGTVRTINGYVDYTLPDRSFLSGAIKNRTRIMTRFSSPGGFETLSRGFLDPAHETFSAYNAMTFRNLSSRAILNTQLQAHQGKFGVSTHTVGTAATVTITVDDGDETHDRTEKEHITIKSTDGTIRRYVITDATSDGSTTTGTVLSDSANTDTGAGTAGADEDKAIAVSLIIGASGKQQHFLSSLKSAIESPNGHGGKIKVSDVPTMADGPQSITLTQAIAGDKGNTSITTDIAEITISNNSFAGGTEPTARVFGAEAAGTSRSQDYDISGDASRHKYHRNNIERIEFTGDHPTSISASFVTASSFDNAFVSHMIPRTDNQTRWITASLI